MSGISTLSNEIMLEMKNMIRETVAETVKETLFEVGIIVDTNDNIVEARKDAMHLRKWRVAVEFVENVSIKAAIGIFFSGLAAVLWVGLQDAIRGRH